MFGSSSYAFSVADSAPAGTVVGQVATDPAAGATYASTGGNAAAMFAIGATSGEITVVGTLDYESTPSHTLTVPAGDGRGGIATTTVSSAGSRYACGVPYTRYRGDTSTSVSLASRDERDAARIPERRLARAVNGQGH